MDQAHLLKMENITKSFYGVKVLDKVSVDVYAGEVLALVGENGAGKSTLIKLLNGDYQKDSGSIYLNGQLAQLHQPRDAEDLGIRMIYQERSSSVKGGRPNCSKAPSVDRSSAVTVKTCIVSRRTGSRSRNCAGPAPPTRSWPTDAFWEAA